MIRAALDTLEADYRRWGTGDYTVRLPGTHRLVTSCRLRLGTHSVTAEAFVLRRPEENGERLYHLLLRRNATPRGVAFAVDGAGDVYLVGRLPRAAVSVDELDRLLGAVLSCADDNFVAMLEIGFGTSIRREWQWRVARGESLANLAAFASFADPERGPPGAERTDRRSPR
ncbi:MAG: YbjN domain-containing protein [Actinobacteria bacterium]|nr:YbjN domain-containing protein [Actinomycetota bacterium]MBI3688830.1 YbjN domain-containing protein [Actinomycetota bacterium]